MGLHAKQRRGMNGRFMGPINLLMIAACGEAVPALLPAGITSTTSGQALPGVGIKGKMPSPGRKSEILN